MSVTQARSQLHTLLTQDARSSPTLTDPDLIIPNYGHNYSPTPLASSPTFNTELESPAFEHDEFYTHPGGSAAEVGVAKAVVMPFRMRPPPPTTIGTSSSYRAYDHGDALSDIYEEESTPKSKKARSRTPSPVMSSSPTYRSSEQFSRRRSNRLSNRSDSSTDSDFDTSKIMTSRLAADLAKPDEDMTDIDGLDSKRNSLITNPDDEMSSLNHRAERILANAKKRLTHMEDNLTKARTSVYISPRSSPTLEHHQPAGNLYRSISLAGDRKGFARKSKPLYPIIKTVSAGHLRVLSETAVPTGSSRLSHVPEIRSASALEYRGKTEALFGHSVKQYKNGHSPGSSHSYNSPLRALQEEDDGSPSTAKTSPETPRGLGITSSDSKESLDDVRRPSSGSPSAVQRSTSSASTRSTRELREQMSDLKSKITDLKSKAQADKSRRMSQQSVRTPSPFTSAAEQWYAGAPEYNEPGSPINTNGGVGWSPTRETSTAYIPTSAKQDRAFGDGEVETPQASRFPNEVARSDVNTPHLHRTVPQQNFLNLDEASQMQESQHEDSQGDRYEDENEPIAASEEEQIYLNEALEESLQDAEPEVPSIPDELLDNGEFERHEDRLDAFDYENMFLHSALGNYNGGIRSRSNSDSSVETRRAANMTPPTERGEEDSDRSTSPENQREEEDDQDMSRVPTARAVSRINEEEEPPTPRALLPPRPLWVVKSARSNSIDSVSTVATFATATEGNGSNDGEEDEDGAANILNWGNNNSQQHSPNVNNTALPVCSPALSSNPPTGLGLGNGNLPTPPTAHSRSPSTAMSSPRLRQPANTEVLMASLITLADPTFRMTAPAPRENSAFSDVDKELVIALLRAVGATCSGILTCEREGEFYEAKVARRRLDAARQVLEGILGFEEEEGEEEEEQEEEEELEEGQEEER